MDDQMIDLLAEEFNRIALSSATKSASASKSGCEETEGDIYSNGATCEANGATCEANGATCEANGATCEANGATCEANDATCEANDASCEAIETQEFSPGQGQILPILEKVMNLSTKIQDLKKQHCIISNEMNGMRTNIFAAPEVINALENL
ncbi:hypothetical protein CRG98_028101, partial [Punica granatum]